MSTTSEHIAARDDVDLQFRLIAAAEQIGISNARSVVTSALGALVTKPITINGQVTSLTEAHAYAAERRRALLASEVATSPGLNLNAVTDDHLRAALTAVLSTPPNVELLT